jgi:CRISPR-associated endonuclease Csn1
VQEAAKHNKLSMDDPWDSFFDEVEQNVNNIIVSHRVHRKISGALHEESFYGPTDRQAKKDDKQWLVKRKDVHELSKGELGWDKNTQSFKKGSTKFIRDAKIRKIVQNKVMQKMEEGLSFNKAVASLEEDYPQLFHPKLTSVPIKKVRILYKKNKRNFFEFEDNGDGEVTRLAVYGKIHHIAIYNSKDDSNRKDREGVAVPMMEAARRDRNDEPIVLRDDPDMGSFIASFSQDEMIKNNEDDQIYRLKKKSTSKKMTFQKHKSSLKESEDPDILRRMPNTLDAQKITVSPIGKIKPAND